MVGVAFLIHSAGVQPMDVLTNTASALEEKVHVLHSLQALDLYA